ncbi:anhydro-N-acetylmuramic acid kinase [uncultured Paenibacillus sp.]|uniref:anhydro-N-acetylmuramic acid kinase n=1 Tax=uncultured Paenibacillus sp. TaxID=227322 RepID=UPI0015B31C92|nr:anhydro-N-acetylmuramic acid kinase [uncultured Paenibacillus sp.]
MKVKGVAKRSEGADAVRRYAVGLMSGTSVDGIDAAVVEIRGDLSGTGQLEARLLAFENLPYPEKAREEIFALFEPRQATIDRVGRLNVWLGELFAQAALAVIRKAGLTPADIAWIGSHGQTIYHAPESNILDGLDLRYTVQIGEGAVIAERTGIPCVSDFRVADLAAGGQGAPLVPYTEYLLYRETKRTLLLQNIGGIGNLTVLPGGCRADQVYAFDTGPGNVLIDGVVARLTQGKETMDAGGSMAGRGRVDGKLLELLMQEPYYRQPIPKSTGRELFSASYVDRVLEYHDRNRLSAEDLVATVTRLTAWTIGEGYRRFVRDRHVADALIVGGGGSHNPVLMNMLREEMNAMGVSVMKQEDLGYSSDAKEAVAFALLAGCTLAGRPNNLPGVTGAARPVVMGKISYSFHGREGER